MFDIYLFTFAKKENSTKQPSLTGQTPFQCGIKSPSSLINPLIELHSNTNPVAFNYAYIPEFNRYFFVSDWRYDRGLWFANLSVDVLATYKPYIGDTNMYITRSSAENDPYIADKTYPNTSSHTIVNEDASDTVVGWDDGYYIVNTLSNAGDGVRSWAMTSSEFNKLIDRLNTTLNGLDWSDVPNALTNFVTNPSQYLVSAFWFPHSFSGTTKSEIKVGVIPITCSCKAVSAFQPISYTFNIPKHPKSSSVGMYLNLAPYSFYTLSFPCMGAVRLDSSKLVDASKMILGALVDPVTGVAEFVATAYTSTNVSLGEVLHCSVPWGVPVALSKDQAGLGQMVSSALDITSGVLSSTPILGLTAGSVGAVAGVITAVDDITSSSQRISNYGNFASHSAVRRLEAMFFDVVDTDNTNNGRPLCKIRKPSTLGGYMVAEKCVLDCPATDGELASLRRYVESGFYYE